MTHTPTPWEIEPVNTEMIIQSGSCPYRYVAVVDGCQAMSEEEEKANAEFIVLAVNCHDELLKVCQEMMGVLEVIDFCELSADYDSIPFAEWEAAIAKAEGV